MTSSLHILGIRHHGPGSAWCVERALEHLRPDCVLIEGPPDAQTILDYAADPAMRPPVAILVYDESDPSEAAYWPFAEFSPEWRAIRWGLAHRAEVRFIDLPRSMRSAGEGAEATPSTDPLEELARAAGDDEGESWWNRAVEEAAARDASPLGVLDAVRDAMAALREGRPARDPDEAPREAHMRRCIRAAKRDGFERIAVVCGAWHAPVLTAEALESIPAKQDDELLKGRAKCKTLATWVAWSHERLGRASGYGAGVASPGWYQHCWQTTTTAQARASLWLARAARTLREEGLDASPAQVIDATRLADALAAIRGRPEPGLDDLDEAALAILTHGQPMPLALLRRKLTMGEVVGEVPSTVPTTPLQRDLEAQQAAVRLKPAGLEKDIDLDLREDLGRARSELLHRLRLLGVGWGELREEAGPRGGRSGSFRETWRLQWKPEHVVAAIEAGRFGTTVASASDGAVRHAGASAASLAQLTPLLEDVLLANLTEGAAYLAVRLDELAAGSGDCGSLMDALPPLTRAMRYGTIRGTDRAMMHDLSRRVLGRISAALAGSCVGIDDEQAREACARIERVDAELRVLDDGEFQETWRGALATLADSGAAHARCASRALRLLLDCGARSAADAARALSLALSPAAGAGHSAAWIEGFLSGGGMLLVHDDALLGLLDEWLGGLDAERFEKTLPILRRTFASFEAPERRQIGERLRARDGTVAVRPDESIDEARAVLVDPVLDLILGENRP